jgi:hypothetical protein
MVIIFGNSSFILSKSDPHFVKLHGRLKNEEDEWVKSHSLWWTSWMAQKGGWVSTRGPMSLGFRPKVRTTLRITLTCILYIFSDIQISHSTHTNLSFLSHLAFPTYFEKLMCILYSSWSTFSSINNYDFVLMKCLFGVNLEMAKPWRSKLSSKSHWTFVLMKRQGSWQATLGGPT